MAIAAAIFIIWDHIFTVMGVWGFNAQHLSGFHVLSLPIEEVLFFICIPFSCLFIYEVILYFFKDLFIEKLSIFLSCILIVLLLGMGVFYFSKIYTFLTFSMLAVFLFMHACV